jgi:hypothetical protein
MTLQHISPGENKKGCKKCCISSAVDGTNGMLWNNSKEDGDVGSECEKYDTLMVKMETVTLIGKVDGI